MAAKKAPTKNAPAKSETTAAKKSAKAPVSEATKLKAVKERYSKSQVLTHIAETTELSRKQVGSVLDELTSLIEAHISKKGCGEFVFPGLMKIVTVKKPARKAHKGINRFTGEEMMFAAKPASTRVKVRALKKMKEMVE